MRVTYVARSFLDYRIPVLEAMDREIGGGLNVVFSADYVPQRITRKVQGILGERAVGMTGEKRIGPNSTQGFANRAFRLVYQPGILKAIAATRPDVLVGDGFYQWTSFALAHRLRFATPLVVCYERTFHTERSAQRIRLFYRKQVLRLVDAMAVNGRLAREYSEWLGMEPERITVGQMAADTVGLAAAVAGVSAEDKAALRVSWGSPATVFLLVSQLIERKGIVELLTAWAGVEARYGGLAALVVVGGGPQEAELKQQSASQNLQHVHWAGSVDYDSIGPYYAAADAFVIPTLEDNWSLVVPEAMACGLPILCSCYNGCHPELVEPGGNGWVFDPLDEGDTRDTLCRALEAKDALPLMGARSVEIVGSHTPDHAAASILQACQIALERRGGGAA